LLSWMLISSGMTLELHVYRSSDEITELQYLNASW